MTPRQFARRLRTASRRLLPEVVSAEVATAQDALREAKALSEGSLTKRDLAKAGHPYRPGGSPPQDAAIINRQGSTAGGPAFADSWDWEYDRAGRGVTVRIVNRSRQAELLNEGTPRMQARPTAERIRERIAPRRLARLARAWDRTWSQ